MGMLSALAVAILANSNGGNAHVDVDPFTQSLVLNTGGDFGYNFATQGLDYEIAPGVSVPLF